MLNMQERLLLWRRQLDHSNHPEILSAIAYKATELFHCTKYSGSIGSSPLREVPTRVLALPLKTEKPRGIACTLRLVFPVATRSRLVSRAIGKATGVLPIHGHFCLRVMLLNSRRGPHFPVHLICAIVTVTCGMLLDITLS